jgi:hypothetical protein
MKYVLIAASILILAAGCSSTVKPANNLAAPMSLVEWKAETRPGKNEDTRIVLVNRETEAEKDFGLTASQIIKPIFPHENDPLPTSNIQVLGDTPYGEEFYICISGEYGCGGNVYGVNVNTRNLREIKSAGGGLTVHPQGDRGVLAIATQEVEASHYQNDLYLVCFESDARKPIIALKGKEVLNQRPPEIDNYMDIRWIDQGLIEFSVYRMQMQNVDQPRENPLLRKQQVIAPEC